MTALRYLHLLAMAFFRGRTAHARGRGPSGAASSAARPQLRATARRFGWGTLIAIAILVATGIPLASEFGRWSDGVLHAKLALVAAVAGLTVWHVRRPDLHALEAAVFVGSLVIVARRLASALGRRRRGASAGAGPALGHLGERVDSATPITTGRVTRA